MVSTAPIRSHRSGDPGWWGHSWASVARFLLSVTEPPQHQGCLVAQLEDYVSHQSLWASRCDPETKSWPLGCERRRECPSAPVLREGKSLPSTSSSSPPLGCSSPGAVSRLGQADGGDPRGWGTRREEWGCLHDPTEQSPPLTLAHLPTAGLGQRGKQNLTGGYTISGSFYYSSISRPRTDVPRIHTLTHTPMHTRARTHTHRHRQDGYKCFQDNGLFFPRECALFSPILACLILP